MVNVTYIGLKMGEHARNVKQQHSAINNIVCIEQVSLDG